MARKRILRLGDIRRMGGTPFVFTRGGFVRVTTPPSKRKRRR